MDLQGHVYVVQREPDLNPPVRRFRFGQCSEGDVRCCVQRADLAARPAQSTTECSEAGSDEGTESRRGGKTERDHFGWHHS